MKGLHKCHLYFGFLALFSLLCLVNYFLTRDNNGFKRIKSLNLDMPKFYCYQEIAHYENCENLLNDQPVYHEQLASQCLELKGKMDSCKTKVQGA